jgi:hypothetical protein
VGQELLGWQGSWPQPPSRHRRVAGERREALTGRPHRHSQILNNFSVPELQNLKRYPSRPLKFMINSEGTEEMEGNKFPFGSNIKMEKDFELKTWEGTSF